MSQRETLLHLFCECSYVRCVWFCLENIIHEKKSLTTRLHFEAKDIIFGLTDKNEIIGINLIILYVKKYITLCRENNVIPIWSACTAYLRYQYKIDLNSCNLLGPKKASLLKQRWESVVSLIT